jgi:type II secretory pathway component PulF
VTRSIAALLRAFDDGRDRSEFYRGWRTGHTAGLTHPRILAEVAALGGPTREIRDHLLAGTRAGHDIATLVRQRPQLFEPFEAALLTMAEESGKLERVLGELADFHFRQYKLILKVKKWMAYPMFVSLFAVVALPLPLVFRGMMTAYWVATVGGLALWALQGGLLLARLAQRYQRRPPFVRARFARTLSACIESGLPLGRSVVLAADASGDPTLARHVRRFGDRALAQQPLSVTLAGAPAMTPDLTGILLVAERTGDFGPLRRLAELYEDGFK